MTDQYTSPYTRNLKDQAVSQLRVGIQGIQGIGKTWSALTFPNPTVLNLDRGLVSRIGENLNEIPLYDGKFVNEEMKVPNNNDKNIIDPARHPNRRDAVRRFLHLEGPKYKKGQTLILDSWTSLQNNFDFQQEYEPKYTIKGDIDGFAFWAAKLKYSTEIAEMLKTLEADVVVCIHESFERNEKDQITGIGPLMQGKFRDQFSCHFTDWYRQVCWSLTDSRINKAEMEIIKQYPNCIKNGMCYIWQVIKDEIFLSCKNHMKKLPEGVRYLPADYSIIKKYE